MLKKQSYHNMGSTVNCKTGMARGGCNLVLPQFYDKIIFFNYNGASRSKKAAHATSVLNFNGITVAPAESEDPQESIIRPRIREMYLIKH